jgi:Protein of unknown function (DUF2442)
MEGVSMFKVIEAKPLPGFRLWLKFADGVTGEVDLSDLAGDGVFERWNIPGAFERVQIGRGGNVNWGDDLDLCPDALYMEVTCLKPEDCFPNLTKTADHARG